MGFFDFLKKTGVMKAGGQTWKGDAKDRPLDDPDHQQKMADLDREVDNAMNNSSSSDDSGSSN
ncbi:MAG: hypothetical protein UX02_C0002G0117 [Candidatus Moranbacteria bacterium GW2011_GWC1_45_18]|nr:MAG: hypothetical protein UT79_C0001G0344 [Candidatus Moranbacteria bacterium GW2011_GWC2_40_12]KKT33898.1 MAG: hypothetical protein UW19_C0004G0028 [Candidatus Moranbacteria bacterium GW2011_GWF2_44_10]KKT99798.1 MAG: hypothetical protein UX02_C0002G0117 [Candidatus Moranbacteria bacterium GW2011_GWC1_45_18]OGI23411.1 MAG: hypothetical protein A2194_02385 [Candidatus Moranbacteria bacterium RIFOXYA1_FULL_44_8]OGI34978.1 MAG: hypothetical protein A2407_00435 [Candidatus Moranbacteria bacteri